MTDIFRVTSWWPPAKRRAQRHTSLRWDFWFHCLAYRDTDEWFAEYRRLEADLEATR